MDNIGVTPLKLVQLVDVSLNIITDQDLRGK